MSTIQAVPEPVAEEAAPIERQLRFDGMPISAHTIIVQGNIGVAGDAVRRWKLGQQVQLSVTAVVTSRKHKASTTHGEATGEVDHYLTLHVFDVELPE